MYALLTVNFTENDLERIIGTSALTKVMYMITSVFAC